MKSAGNIKKGIYLVGDARLFQTGTGAYQHIKMGMEQLSAYYDMRLVTPGNNGVNEAATTKTNSVPAPIKNGSPYSLLPSKFRGTIKYLYWLLRNNAGIFKLYRTIKKDRPDFIYERCCILDFKGVLVAKMLRIPHFYENNGILIYQFHKNFFSSYIQKPLLYLERLSHRASDFIFYIGTWGQVFRSSKPNWVNIENGIEKAWIENNQNITKNIQADTIQCCVLGHLMKHHNVDILTTAFRLIESSRKIRLTFVGSVDAQVLQSLRDAVKGKDIDIEHAGILDRKALFAVLQQTHIGIVTGAHEYQSMMKLLDYGAAKCLVVAPDTYNLTYWFPEDQVLFFRKEDGRDLAAKLQLVIDTPGMIAGYGERLYEAVKNNFTWDKVFLTKSIQINKIIESV